MPRDQKKRFALELDPLLYRAQEAISAGDAAEAKKCSLAMLKLVQKYSTILSREDIRDVLNGPTANAIADRLGLPRGTP